MKPGITGYSSFSWFELVTRPIWPVASILQKRSFSFLCFFFSPNSISFINSYAPFFICFAIFPCPAFLSFSLKWGSLTPFKASFWKPLAGSWFIGWFLPASARGVFLSLPSHDLGSYSPVQEPLRHRRVCRLLVRLGPCCRRQR